MPEEWRSLVLLTFKNKGASRIVATRGIKLMSHKMKTCERVAEDGLSTEVCICELTSKVVLSWTFSGTKMSLLLQRLKLTSVITIHSDWRLYY